MAQLSTEISWRPWQVQSDPVSHRYVVHISDTGLLAPTRARSATDLGSDGRVIPPSPTSPAGVGLGLDGRGSPTTGARRSSHQYRFDCELGDVWTELTTSTSSGAALALATTHRTPRRTTATSTTSSSANTTVRHTVYFRFPFCRHTVLKFQHRLGLEKNRCDIWDHVH